MDATGNSVLHCKIHFTSMLRLERFVLALVFGGLPVGSSTLLACASKTGAFGFAAPAPPGNPGLWLKLLKSGKPALHDHSGNLKTLQKIFA